MIFLSLLSLALYASATPLGKRKASNAVPSYVLDYAPMVYLYTSDPYRPSDIGNQLVHTTPELNFTSMKDVPSPMTLDNLNDLNNLDGDNGTYVYLTSKDNVADNPAWLNGVKPNSKGKTSGASSCAIIVTDHGGGMVDAFYMYFYAFNFGGVYLGQTFGDHVGDWEHNMVRFQDGKPQAVWYSQHDNGEAFEYDILEKYEDGKRVRLLRSHQTTPNFETNLVTASSIFRNRIPRQLRHHRKPCPRHPRCESTSRPTNGLLQQRSAMGPNLERLLLLVRP